MELFSIHKKMGKWIKIIKGCLSIYPCANLPSRLQRCVWKMRSWPGTSCRSRWESAAGPGTRWWPAGSARRRWREASRLCTGKTPWWRKLGCYLVLLVSFLVLRMMAPVLAHLWLHIQTGSFIHLKGWPSPGMLCVTCRKTCNFWPP